MAAPRQRGWGTGGILCAAGHSSGHEFLGGPRRPASGTGPDNLEMPPTLTRAVSTPRLLTWAVLCSLFLTAGSLNMVFGLVDASKAIAAMFWPTTEGRVVSSEVVESQSGRGTTLIPLVVYTYDVGGATYRGNRIYYSSNPKDRDPGVNAERTIAAFPADSLVKVYYDPSEPQRSVLRPGVNWFSMFWLAFATALVALSVNGIRYVRRAWKQR